MKIEYNLINNNKTQDLIPLLKGAKVLKTKWVYKIKNPENNLDLNKITFKSRFITKRFKQLYNLNYLKTYILVIKQIT